MDIHCQRCSYVADGLLDHENHQRTHEAQEDPGMCDCGHDGIDGHDMRSVPPDCMTPGCACGEPEEIPESELRVLDGNR